MPFASKRSAFHTATLRPLPSDCSVAAPPPRSRMACIDAAGRSLHRPPCGRSDAARSAPSTTAP
eukprot:5095903-Prymnesium_polylepis.1